MALTNIDQIGLLQTTGNQRARELFTLAGFDTIPLREGEKVPARNNWQGASSFRLWKYASEANNIGVRGGGIAGAAFIDCDHEQTFINARDYMDGLGFQPGSYPVVQTASGSGRHIYTALKGELPGDWRKLSQEFGAGELRYGSGAFVVAPPSIVDQAQYNLVEGDYRNLPELEVPDILPILANQIIEPAQTTRRMSRLAASILAGGEALKRYETRSDAEMGLMNSLINTGYKYNQIQLLFLKNPCAGKFHELNKENTQLADHWLKRTYLSALDWCERKTSEPRKIAERLNAWAQSRAWGGRTGISDRAVFLEHTKKAWLAGSKKYNLSVREIAEGAAISAGTASRANRRLISNGLIEITRQASLDCAAEFQFGELALTEIDQGRDVIGAFMSTVYDQDISLCINDTYPHSTYEDMLHEGTKTAGIHDAFRTRGLGKSAWEVLQALKTFQEGLTPKELAEITGRHKRTVYGVLERLSGQGKRKIIDSFTGEVICLVRKDKKKWVAVPGVDLDQIARLVRTYGMSARQKKEHAEDRRMHRRGLEIWDSAEKIRAGD